MMIQVNGQYIDPGFINYREMNFGQKSKEEQEVPYELSVPLGFYLALMQDFYEEIAEDDLIYGKENTLPLYLKFRELGWPSFDWLFYHHQVSLLSNFIREHLAYDSIILLFEKEGPFDKTPVYFINSIDSVRIWNQTITLGGVAVTRETLLQRVLGDPQSRQKKLKGNNVIAFINGQEIDVSLFLIIESSTIDSVNNSGNPKITTILPYELAISLHPFLQTFDLYYDQYKIDSLVYEQEYNEPYLLALEELNWPSLGYLLIENRKLLLDFLKDDPNIFAVIKSFLSQESGPPKKPLYSIISIEQITIKNAMIVFKGDAFLKTSLTEKQQKEGNIQSCKELI